MIWETRPRTILGRQERRTGLINRGYICYRRARGWMAIVRRRDSSQLALITATRHGLTVRSRIMPIGGTTLYFHLGQKTRGPVRAHRSVWTCRFLVIKSRISAASGKCLANCCELASFVKHSMNRFATDNINKMRNVPYSLTFDVVSS